MYTRIYLMQNVFSVTCIISCVNVFRDSEPPMIMENIALKNEQPEGSIVIFGFFCYICISLQRLQRTYNAFNGTFVTILRESTSASETKSARRFLNERDSSVHIFIYTYYDGLYVYMYV